MCRSHSTPNNVVVEWGRRCLHSPVGDKSGGGGGVRPHCCSQPRIGNESGWVGEKGHKRLSAKGHLLTSHLAIWVGKGSRREVEGSGLHGGSLAQVAAQFAAAGQD